MLTDADLLAVERELCKRSLAAFARQAWHVLEPGADLKWGWALDAICKHLEAVTDGKITRLLMNVPPGSMKSLLTGVLWPAWEWGPRGMPHKRFIGTAHEEGLAIRDSRKCRDLIKSEWYQKLWPLELAADLDGKREFGNTFKGVRQARSFTSMTGVRGDCLLAGTMVETEDGIKDIKEMVMSAYSGNVLSYDHDSNHLVYRPVQAVARRSSLYFYRVHFADGSVVECTGDHQIYTTGGYKPASLLSTGDACLRMLPKAHCQNSGGHEEAREKRLQACLVLKEVHPNNDQHGARKDGAELHNLRSEDSQEQAPMLSGVQIGCVVEEGHGDAQGHGRVFMSCMQDGKTEAVVGQSSQILLGAVQGRSPCCIDAREEQSRLEKWCKCRKVRQGDQACICDCKKNCSGRGWASLCSLPVGSSASLSSHRPRFHQQPLAELSDTLPSLPYEASRSGAIKVQEVAVSLVERVCEETDVYDIQVAGTHCFFANGVLVHNCVILDDPLSADSANSEAKLEAVRLAFTETLPTRINNDQSAIVVVMQRLHEKDTSGVILDMGLPYVHLCIPMRYERARHCTTAIGWSDPRTVEGELMFPERFSEQQVQELERTLGSYGTAGQLQQRPAPRGGGIIKTEWWKYWTVLPALEFRFITADTAQKTGQENDYSVLQCWGRSTTGQAVLIDQIRGKWEAPDLLVHARAFWLKHQAGKSPIRSMMVEDKVSGTGLIQSLRREGVPVIPVQRSKDKISRAHDAAPFIESGNVLLPIDAPWLSDFLSEAETFPGGSHDDQLDPAFDAISHVQRAPAMPKPAASAPIPIAHRW